ncbi:ATP-dependent RNA helicase HrpB [Sinobacterium norvegicum]|uniref:ATP-dependent RNA helicase HrpB n=1 Tax=Sinobacterium norvegicum TaxID=1641715 RepID=A0ABN8ECD9_9GAMM|nr:ATP-dependent helicase HrpB [Sinobacterium norvegicum]CAH0990153.1 ATP-dependent RNA helicase HrpB [Sinobacterium norvegicum]
MSLPIKAILPEVFESLLVSNKLVVIAEPGAGKTTGLPLALLTQPWLGDKKILVIQPRRLSAQTAAERMAQSLGESVGHTVGYRTGTKSQCRSSTVIEVVTEGVYIRMLQSDPSMEGWGAVLFDEFHERNANSDLSLALTLEAVSLFYEDKTSPKLIVMSATMEAEPITELVGGCEVIRSKGRQFPVSVRYMPSPSRASYFQRMEFMAEVVVQALADYSGDVLVFVAGVGEISWLLNALSSVDADVYPLHASLAIEQQRRAIDPSARRKVIIATNIAETGVTIDGVEVVVDSGFEKVAEFDLNTSMTRLEQVAISRASADQRKGRAGRTAAGYCIRCWSQEKTLLAARPAELMRIDCSSTMLELAAWGDSDFSAYRWLQQPSSAAVAVAEHSLLSIGAIDGETAVTALGERITRYGVEPRIAVMLDYAQRQDGGEVVQQALTLCAILSEADIIDQQQAGSGSLLARLEVVAFGAGPLKIHHNRLARVKHLAKQLARKVGVTWQYTHVEPAIIAELLLQAWPGRLARQRSKGEGEYLLASGQGAMLSDNEKAQWLFAPVIISSRGINRIGQFLTLSDDFISEHIRPRATVATRFEFDRQSESVRARRVTHFNAIELSSSSEVDVDKDALSQWWQNYIEQVGVECLQLSRLQDYQQLVAKLAIYRQYHDDLPLLDSSWLIAHLDDWFVPYISGVKSLAQLRAVPWSRHIQSSLSWQQMNILENLMPASFLLPSGEPAKIDYINEAGPIVRGRIQQFFGLDRSPSLFNGRLALIVDLLSPARRSLQITSDLKGFWQGSYESIKKEMKGRYPRHYWPDNPLEAEPTNRTKKSDDQRRKKR